MSTKYYAWKDGIQSNGKQDWVELTPNEFIEICNNNRRVKQGQRRYFYQLPGLEEGDYYLYLECTYEQYKVSRAEKEMRARRKKEKENLISSGLWYATVSLDEIVEDESGEPCALHELIADPSSSFEDNLIMNMTLYKALETLSDEERDLIYDLFFDPDGEISVSELSKRTGIPRRTIGCRKKKILEKLRKSFASF